MISNPWSYAPDQPDPLLEVRNLSLKLSSEVGEKPILDNISFWIVPGRITAVMGRSGIGKSLLLKAILGFLTGPKWALAGDIILWRWAAGREASAPAGEFILKDGEYVGKRAAELRGKQLFAVFQGADTHLNPAMPIGKQLAEALGNGGGKVAIRAETTRRLVQVGLHPSDAGKYPHELSQGQRQRVLIAMGLGSSGIVLADEPTSALDPHFRDQIMALLKDLRADGLLKSLLLVTHDLGLIKLLLSAEDEIHVLDRYGSLGARIVQTVHRNELWDRAVVEGPEPQDVPSLHPLLVPKDFSEGAGRPRSDRLPDPVLVIENLTQGVRSGVLRRERKILKNIHLEVREGEFLGIVGHSGCGKSTLVKAMARLVGNTKGSIWYYPAPGSAAPSCLDLVGVQPDGTKPDSPTMCKLRRKIQVVFQDSGSTFNPRMTVAEILEETVSTVLGITDPQEISSRVLGSLFRVGLCRSGDEVEEILSAHPGSLSGGERQRLAIARAFLLQPRLVIADEPFADQDALSKASILELMRKLRNRRNTAFVLVSHDVELIDQSCDRIVAIDDRGMLSLVIDKRDVHSGAPEECGRCT